MSKYTNIFEFTSDLEFLTVATIAGIVTVKFVNRLYEEFYDPLVQTIIPDEYCSQVYYIGGYPVRYGIIMREFIKWIMLIILLMVVYNYLERK